ncbi:MAG: amino acid permease [Endomicrobium sp.]|jgi:AAT family amino acid transporter|nr:amino acid permease [Endomicrobium sp.]
MQDSNQEHLKRDLNERHIHLIAIGGAMGTGIFLAVGKAISSAGPSIILSYIISSVVIYLIMRALGEVAVEEPISGSFSAYAHKFISPFAGFMVGWSYWFLWSISCMVQVTAVGIYCNFWWPFLPQWIPALLTLIFITFINLLNVKIFGELGFWLAIIKVFALISIVLTGIVIIFLGVNNKDTVVFSNLYRLKGGFFPFGVNGVLQALVIAMFAFIGVEFIGITADEVKDPQKTIPSTISKTIPFISLLYIMPIFVVLCMYPWTNLSRGEGVQESVFVTTFLWLGIKKAPSILNFVVIMAAISACNSGVFSNSRMLYNLALKKDAPAFLAKTSLTKVPINAVLFSSIIVSVGVIVNFLIPKKAFLFLLNTTTTLAMFTWISIVLVQMKRRHLMSKEDIVKLKYPMPCYPYSNIFIFAILVASIVGLLLDNTIRSSVFIGLGCLVVLYAVHKLFLRDRILFK